MERLLKALDKSPIIAILRGVQPDEVLKIADEIIASGIGAIEIPFNSPDPLLSIEFLANKFGQDILVGCGTVTKEADLVSAHNAGAELALHPHANPILVKKAKNLNMISVPGVMTPTESFNMLDAGADALKLFPCEVIGPEGVAAFKAILPKEVLLIGVGGISSENIEIFWNSGVRGFALASNIFKPGMSPLDVRQEVQSLSTTVSQFSEIDQREIVIS